MVKLKGFEKEVKDMKDITKTREKLGRDAKGIPGNYDRTHVNDKLNNPRRRYHEPFQMLGEFYRPNKIEITDYFY